MQKVKPKKFLGQHFLTDLSVAERIADTLKDYVGTPVLEVGPGMGVLTQYLIAKGHDLKVVELDRESVDYLHANFPELEGEVIGEDFLQLDPRDRVKVSMEFIKLIMPRNISIDDGEARLTIEDRLLALSGDDSATEN